MTAVQTNGTSFFDYFLLEYTDDRDNAPVDGMRYANNLISECFANYIYFSQTVSFPFQDNV